MTNETGTNIPKALAEAELANVRKFEARAIAAEADVKRLTKERDESDANAAMAMAAGKLLTIDYARLRSVASEALIRGYERNGLQIYTDDGQLKAALTPADGERR